MPKKTPRSVSFFELDLGIVTSQLGSCLLHGAFLAVLFLVPPLPQSICVDSFESGDRFASYLLAPNTHVGSEQRLPESSIVVLRFGKRISTGPGRRITKNRAQNGSRERHRYSAPGGRGMRHAGEGGQLGSPDAAIAERRYSITGSPNDSEVQMARAREKALSSVLQVLSSSAPTSPFGQLAAAGRDPESHLGALMGHQIGDARGLNGLGLRGTGRGGGGHGEGTIGLGNMATVGHGAGGGGGSGYGRGDGHGGTGTGWGSGAGGLRGRRVSVPTISGGSVRASGSLDRELIRRYLRRHRNEIRYCYERRLAQRPDLSGRVLLRFTIDRAGRVVHSETASTTISDHEVEACVARVVERIQFPAPEGDETIIVSYPFFFQQVLE
jgi:hypothetical protein